MLVLSIYCDSQLDHVLPTVHSLNFEPDSEEDDDPVKLREKELEQWHSRQLAVGNTTGFCLHFRTPYSLERGLILCGFCGTEWSSNYK